MSAPARSFAILRVEDDVDHAELVLRCLGQHVPAATIHHVSDGQAALDYLLKPDPPTARKPDLILLDLPMPRVDGFAVLRDVKTLPALRHIPVVVLTTSDAKRDIVRAYEMHANSYLVKPIDFAKFNLLMRDFGLYWEGWNKNP